MGVKKVEIYVGSACNNNCLFCSISKRVLKCKPEEQIMKEIFEAKEMDPLRIDFTGGEPTIRKNLPLWVFAASQFVKDVRMTTNGRMLMYEKYTKELVEHGLKGAVFSIHGAKPETHDYLVSVPDAFNQLVKGMDNLVDYGGIIDINTVVTSKNFKELPEMAERFMSKYSVESLCLIFPTLEGNMLKNIQLLEKYEVIIPYALKSIEIAESFGTSGWLYNVPPCLLNDELAEYIGSMNFDTVIIWEKDRTNLDETKHLLGEHLSVCSECAYKTSCPGFPKEYLKKFGAPEGIKPKKEVV